jgi:hypothetical protein
MNWRSWLTAAAGSLTLVTGAAAEPLLPVVTAELVPTQPPLPKREVEVKPEARASDWERTGGCWHWRRGSWVWMSPRWQRRPASNVRWVPPDYVREDGRWRYVPGHWSSQRVVLPARDRTRHAIFLHGSVRAAR